MVTIAQDAPDFQRLLFQALAGEQIANTSLLVLYFALRLPQRGPPGTPNRTRGSSAGNSSFPNWAQNFLR